MSYRRSKATTERIRRQIEAMRRGKERAAMARATRDYPPPLPLLRRVVTITDYATGEPVTHEADELQKLVKAGEMLALTTLACSKTPNVGIEPPRSGRLE